MKKLEDAKADYESMPPPPELEQTVEQALESKPVPSASHRKGWIAVVVAACACIVFVVALNASSVFALGLYDVPVLGNVARVFTFREYEEKNDANLVIVKMPAIRNTGNSQLESRINYEILLKMKREIEDAKTRAREYQQAFVKTGGDQADFIPIEIMLDYEIKCSNQEVVSFVITKNETMASCYTEQFFYNIDLETGRELTLANLFGADYIDTINSSVKKQIGQMKKDDPDAVFFDEGEEVFRSISADQGFYLNGDGNVVVVFPKYSIAPGSMGILEFEVSLTDLPAKPSTSTPTTTQTVTHNNSQPESTSPTAQP